MRSPRTRLPLQLGTYDPLPSTLDGIKEVRIRVDRIKYWLSVGAQPSERVAYLLWRAGLAPSPPIRWQTEANVGRKARKAAAAAAGKRSFHSAACAEVGAVSSGRVPCAGTARAAPPLPRLGRFAALVPAQQPLR